MKQRLHSLFVCLLLLISQCAIPSALAVSPSTGSVPAAELTTLRQALKTNLLSFKLTGDGQTTSKVTLTLTNKTDHALRVLIPANETFKPGKIGIQNMLCTRDKLCTVDANSSITVEVPTVCASTKTVPPPPADGVEWTCGNYPDPEVWKQIACILDASRELFKSGAYDKTMFAKERKESTISQLAVWSLLGKKSDNPEDKVTPEAISKDTLDKMGIKPEQLSPEKLAKFSKGVDEIFAAVDLTLKKAKDPTIVANAALPSDSPLDTYLKVGQKAVNNGDFSTAEELLTAAVDESAKLGDADPHMATALAALGNCYLFQGNAAESEQYLRKAAQIRSKSSPDSADAGNAYHSLGLACRLQGKKGEAEEFLSKAVTAREKSLGANSTPVAEASNNLAIAMVQNDKYPEAEQLFKKAMAIRYSNLGEDSAELAETKKNLADLYVKDGKFPKAQQLYKEALNIDQKVLGADHPYLCNILDGLAETYKGLNKESDAEEMSKQAQALREKHLGTNANLVAAVPDNHLAVERLANYAKSLATVEAGVQQVRKTSSAALASAGAASKFNANKPVKDKWALVIGISKFKDPDITLRYASKDAKDFADYLVKEGNFKQDHVRLLTDDQATRENILAELGDRWLPRVAAPDDLVVIYISSHGSPSKADVRGTNYLVAYNTDKNSLYATGVPMQDLSKIVKERVHSDRIVMLLDACHSGAVTPAAKGIFRQSNFDAEQIVQGTGQLVICSSEPSQTSWESSKYPNGVFTHYLIEGLRKQGAKTPLGSAFQFMKDNVQGEVLRDRGELQTPVLKSRWEGSELLLGVPPAEPRAGL